MQISELYGIFKQHPEVTTDTRSIIPGSLFFALKGENFNGNNFAVQAIEKGCAFAIVDDREISGDKLIHVNDVLASLQQLAAYHRKQCKAKVFAVTGSNGKTTTKELIASVLQVSKNIIYTQGNLNNHIGVPITLLKIKDNTEIAVIEMGANHPGEIDMLCRIADPDAGLITNVGLAHIEGFGSFEGVVNTKTELYRYLHERKRPAIVNAQNSHLMKHSDSATDMFYNGDEQSLVSGTLYGKEVFISVEWKDASGNMRKVNTQLSGDYNLENILAALTVGSYFGINGDLMNKAIADYVPSNKRSQLFRSANNEVLIDAYNANPTSMKAAIDNMSRLDKKNKVLILGDMFELGNESAAEHNKILQHIISNRFQEVFLAGKYFYDLRKSAPFHFFRDTESLSLYLKEHPVSESFFLLKGSRGMRMETLLDTL